MSKSIDGLNDALKAEVAFAVTQFNQLSEEERKQILGLIGNKSKAERTKGALRVGQLLCNASPLVLANFMNDRLYAGEKVFDIYMTHTSAAQCNQKMLMVAMYFHENLPKDGSTTIPPVPSS